MNKSIRRSINRRRSKQHRTKHLHRRSKHSNRRKAIRSRKHTSNDARYHGLIGDLCPMGSSVLNNGFDSDYKPRYQRICFKNCNMDENESETAYYRQCTKIRRPDTVSRN